MFFRIHPYPVLGIAAATVRFIEGAVASVKYVHFGVRELGVTVGIDPTILIAKKLSPCRY